MMLVWILFVYVVTFLNYVQASSPGELCNLRNGSTGICTHFRSCESAKHNLIKLKIAPKLCSFDRREPIICCPEQTTSSPTYETTTELHTLKRSYGNVSLENCKYYASLVLVNISSPILLPGVEYEIEDTCAIENETYRENFVKAREFPHLASIGYDLGSEKAWKCTGALISQQHVLTAATCSYLPQLGAAKYVRVGSTSVRENFYHEKPLQYSNIKEFIKHPRFNNLTLANNLAIVKLETSVKFTSIVRPTCLGVYSSNNKEAINVGWGTFNKGYLNNEPLKNILRITESGTCGTLEENQICVEEMAETLGQNCLIDQGSPLQQYNDNHYCAYNLIGILSDWKDCNKAKPGIYTNVSTYIPWIEKLVWG